MMYYAIILYLIDGFLNPTLNLGVSPYLGPSTYLHILKLYENLILDLPLSSFTGPERICDNCRPVEPNAIFGQDKAAIPASQLKFESLRVERGVALDRSVTYM